MTRKNLTVLTVFLSVLLFAVLAQAHCQLPCDIYDDEARLMEISEDVTTLDKAVAMITELQAEKNINYNQLVRWIDNKDHHAANIQEIASQYFLAQRIKFDDAQYDKKLAALHQVIVYAMKCKQTVDKEMVEKLREACRSFEQLYLGKK
jgi:nickel superoxide dismutase